MVTYLTSQDFPHHMATTDFLLEVARIPTLYPDILVIDLIHYYRIHADPAHTPIKPDSVLKLRLPKSFTICLEVDLGTEGEEKIKAKVAAYYNGPRNLDTKRGENKIYSRHDEKTV